MQIVLTETARAIVEPQGLRQFRVRPDENVLFSRRIDEGIRLIRVLHGRPDIPTVFREEPTEGRIGVGIVGFSPQIWDNSFRWAG